MTSEPAAVLYAWSPAARFGRVVPKSRIYTHTRVTAKLRERFVNQVQRITWAFKLAEVSIGLPGTKSVPEIDVISVETKHGALDDDVLVAVARAVPQSLVFEVVDAAGGDERRRTAVVTTSRESGSTTRRVHSGAWCTADHVRSRLPQAIDLTGLYAGLVAPLLPVAYNPGEPLTVTVERAERADALCRQIERAEKCLTREVQFNRKVELRQSIRDLQRELDALTAPVATQTDDRRKVSWTS